MKIKTKPKTGEKGSRAMSRVHDLAIYFGKTWPGCLVYPLDDPRSGVRPNISLNIAQTYVILDENENFIQCLTVMPDGLYVAWTTCGSCATQVNVCKCPGGFVAVRSIEYIHDQTVAKLAGEEWGVGHQNYLGSLKAARARQFSAANRREDPLYAKCSAPVKPTLEKSSPIGEFRKKLRLKKLDLDSSDRDVEALLRERMGTKKLKRRKI